MAKIMKNMKKFIEKGGEKTVKKAILSLVSLACVLCFTKAAWSYPVFSYEVDNELYFHNLEQWVDVNGDTVVSTGDYFYGVLQTQDIKVGISDKWTHDDIAPGIDSFTGYFLTSVTNVAMIGGVPFIYLGAYAGGSDPKGVITDTEIASGVLMKLYTDTATGYIDSLTATALNAATDGALWAAYGFTGSHNYWYTNAPVSPPVSGFVGTSYLGLDMILNNTGMLFNKVNDPVEGVFNTNVDMYAKSYLYVDTTTSGRFYSNDPAVVNPVPEPASLLLLGSGMLGLAALSRARRKKVRG